MADEPDTTPIDADGAPEDESAPAEPQSTSDPDPSDPLAAVESAEQIAGSAAEQAEESGEEMSEEEAAALASAMGAINAAANPKEPAKPAPASTGDDAASFNPPEFPTSAPGAVSRDMDLIADVHMNVRIELGRTKMYVEDVLSLGDGAVVELDKLAGDPVDVYVNDRKVARGEVLVLNDNFCVRISEILDLREK
jgi:flagellar motor switch protein FliN/FliY